MPEQDDATLVIAAVGLAFILTALNAGEAVLQATATHFVALFFLFLIPAPIRFNLESTRQADDDPQVSENDAPRSHESSNHAS